MPFCLLCNAKPPPILLRPPGHTKKKRKEKEDHLAAEVSETLAKNVRLYFKKRSALK